MVRVGLGLIAVVGSVIGLAGHAGAADLPARAPIYQPPPVFLYNWSGFYIGAHAGGGWGRKHWVDTTFAPLDEGSHDVSGALAGGQIGFNFQAGAWVFGLEGQASWADLTGEHVSLAFPTDRDRTRVDALGTVAGRVGYAFDRVLLYGKGGVAWAHDKFSITDIPSGITYANFVQTRWGWMAGAGLEYGLTANWSAKIEYNYMDLGTVRATNVICSPNFGCGGPGGSFNEDVSQQLHVVKVGINYRFGGPVVAQY